MTATAKSTVQEEELLNLLRDTNTRERGFRLLVEYYRERLYIHAHRMMGSHADADDVLQNAFLKAWRAMDQFKGNSRLYTWLYRITTNEAITLLKQRDRRRYQSLDQEEMGPVMSLAGNAHFDGERAWQLLQNAVAKLPPKQQAVFNLRYFEEMTYQELSEVVGTSVGGLKASYHHAVKKIEQSLIAQGLSL